MRRNRVAIVVPLTSRSTFTRDEEISLRHLEFHLGRYDRYFIAPRGANVHRPGFRVVTFARRFFGSAATHNLLTHSAMMYSAFKRYEYVLIYHLDSLVFSDRLEYWCNAGVDYIGAPWIPCPQTPWVTEPRVGNGGFTLMKIDSVLRVLERRDSLFSSEYWSELLLRNQHLSSPLFEGLELLQRVMPGSSPLLERPLRRRRISLDPGAHGRNNDYFWSYEAVRYLPSFRVATVEQGLQFAFEAAPRLCFELNGRRLPFGCHAWTKFDRSFWEPHLLPVDARGDDEDQDQDHEHASA